MHTLFTETVSFYGLFSKSNRDVAQLVAHYVRDVGVGRSSRLIPTLRIANTLIFSGLAILSFKYSRKIPVLTQKRPPITLSWRVTGVYLCHSRHSVLLLSVPLWTAVHTNIELTLRRTKCCFASIDVGVLHALVAKHDGNGTDLCRHT